GIFIFALTLIVAGLTFSPSAFAKKKSPNRKPQNEIVQPDFIQKLEKQKAKKNPKALAQAYSSFQKKNCTLTKQHLSGLIQDKEYGDHALYLRAMCAHLDGERNLDSKSWPKAIETAQTGIKDLEK